MATHVLLVRLIFPGWAFALAQLLTKELTGSLAEAGPGIQFFAHVKVYVFGDPFAFESALSFYATGIGAWGVADLLKSAALWLVMIQAIMLPSLLPPGRNISAPATAECNDRRTAGYIFALVLFCAPAISCRAFLEYGANCLRCCGPLMLVMFATGLMNIVAMLVLIFFQRQPHANQFLMQDQSMGIEEEAPAGDWSILLTSSIQKTLSW